MAKERENLFEGAIGGAKKNTRSFTTAGVTPAPAGQTAPEENPGEGEAPAPERKKRKTKPAGEAPVPAASFAPKSKEVKKRRFDGYFRESEFAAWKEFADSRGMSMTELIEACVNHCLGLEG